MGTRFVDAKSRSAKFGRWEHRAPGGNQWRQWSWVGVGIIALLPVWIYAGIAGLAILLVILATASLIVRSGTADLSPPGDIVVVGDGPRALAMAAALGMEPIHHALTGSIFHRARTQSSPPRVVHVRSLIEAQDILPQVACDRVVMLDRTEVHPHIPEDSRGRAPRLVDSYSELERVLGRVPLELLELSGDRNIRPLRRSHAVARRTIDLVVVLPLALLVASILPLVALGIVLESRGPVFYSQTRVGLGGRLFRIHKFRSMRTDAESQGPTWATTNDQRVTRVGRILRSTRIDELPQVWNIIRGDMSLIGPRPERPEFTAIIEQQIPAFGLRTRVKPGITGWAQICAGYGRSINDSRTKLEYDLYYVAHNSLLFDLRILLHTIPVVIGRKGS